MRFVLLPGMDGTGELFVEFANALRSYAEVQVVSYPSAESLSYEELEKHVLASAVTTKDVVLVAESYSTPLAIRWAAHNPGSVIGVVLCAGFARSPIRGVKRRVVAALAPVLLRWRIPDLIVEQLLIGADANRTLVEAVRTAVSQVKPTVLSDRLSEVLACDMRSDLETINVPVLCLQAHLDRLIPASACEEMRALNAKVQLSAIDGPHLLIQREPRKCAEIVAAFASGLG